MEGAVNAISFIEQKPEVSFFDCWRNQPASLNLWRLNELGITRPIEFIEFELLEYANPSPRYCKDAA